MAAAATAAPSPASVEAVMLAATYVSGEEVFGTEENDTGFKANLSRPTVAASEELGGGDDVKVVALAGGRLAATDQRGLKSGASGRNRRGAASEGEEEVEGAERSCLGGVGGG